MEIRKKKFAFYIIILLILAGSITLAFAPQPEEAGPLWERIWNVEQPISIDDYSGSITVDTDDGALEVFGTINVTNDEDPLNVEVTNPVTVTDGDESLTVDGTVNIGNTVTVTDGDESLTVDDGSNSITVDTDEGVLDVAGTVEVSNDVSLEEGTTVGIDGPVTVTGTVELSTPITSPEARTILVYDGTIEGGTSEFYRTCEVRDFEKIYVWVHDSGDVNLLYDWVLNAVDGDTFVQWWVLEHNQLKLPGPINSFELSVKADTIKFGLYNPSDTNSVDITVIVYGIPY